MPRNKIDIKKIHPSLNKICTLCGFAISPADVQRTDFEHIRCSNCGKEFVPALLNKNKSAVGGQFRYIFKYQAEAGTQVCEGVQVYRDEHEHQQLSQSAEEPCKADTLTSGN